jgi:AcrR family transcriptional regulator
MLEMRALCLYSLGGGAFVTTRIPKQAGTIRKAPKQERSRETVAAILEATARILAQRGWAGLNTNAVAEIAGVSVGSLYQYFPNKLALIEAVRRQHFGEILDVLRAAAATSKPRAQRIEILVEGMIVLHSRHPAIHQVLLEEAPRGREAKVAHDAFEAEYLRLYQMLISSRRIIAVHVLSAAIAGVVHDAARRDTLSSPQLKRELVRLVSGYVL